jgi:hypothetical protein
MSQGTSGDLHWMDYGKPKKALSCERYAAAVARIALAAYQKIQYRSDVPLRMCEGTLVLNRRVPDKKRLAWAERIAATFRGAKPRSITQVYAREQLLLAREPVRELKLQALRIGGLGIAALPCEVFGITGLKLKAQSPLDHTMVMELANGEEGYIPPPAQHGLGGYTTWPARTAGLEVQAEPKIVEATLALLEKAAGADCRPITVSHGPFAQAVLNAQPRAYWRLEEFEGPRARDATANSCHGAYENGVAFYLEGPPGASFSGLERTNRAPQFAGGRLRADLMGLGAAYTVELWFWNTLPAGLRPVTGYLFSRGAAAAGDHLGIDEAGRLFFSNDDSFGQTHTGTTPLQVKTWYHVTMVRSGEQMRVHLNGTPAPEIERTTTAGRSPLAAQVFVGGRNDRAAGFEGRIDEVAIYDRALTPEEIRVHYAAATP